MVPCRLAERRIATLPTLEVRPVSDAAIRRGLPQADRSRSFRHGAGAVLVRCELRWLGVRPAPPGCNHIRLLAGRARAGTRIGRRDDLPSTGEPLVETTMNTQPNRCADCGAPFPLPPASGGASGYATTRIPRFPTAEERY